MMKFGLMGFVGMGLMIYGSYRYNTWVGMAVAGYILITVADALRQARANLEHHEREVAMRRHPVMGPSGEISKDDIR